MAALGDSPGDQHRDQQGEPPPDASGSQGRAFAGRPSTPRSSRVAAAAFLRVYEPVAGGSGWSAVREQQAAVAGELPAADQLPGGAEHAAALRAASALPPRVVGDLDLISSDDGRTRTPVLPLSPPAADGVPRACPVDLSWRAMLAIEEFRLSVQPEVLPAFLSPEALAVAHATAGRRAERSARGRHPHILTCPWHVPLSWLVLFSDEGRQQRPLCFRAPMADARRDLARALAAVRRTPTDFLPARRLEDVGRWLEEFHARSVVELDYGGLLPIVSVEEFSAGNSVALMRAALVAIRDGDSDRGLAGMAAIRDRWAAVRAFERAN